MKLIPLETQQHTLTNSYLKKFCPEILSCWSLCVAQVWIYLVSILSKFLTMTLKNKYRMHLQVTFQRRDKQGPVLMWVKPVTRVKAGWPQGYVETSLLGPEQLQSGTWKAHSNVDGMSSYTTTRTPVRWAGTLSQLSSDGSGGVARPYWPPMNSSGRFVWWKKQASSW